MATAFSTTLLPDNSTDVRFQTWAQFLENIFISTGGWALSVEGGLDTVPAVMTKPTAPNQKRGFRVYKMADALQASAPVFIRVDYGSSGATNTPGIWLTIGNSSNGSGVITGVLYNGGASGTPNISSNTNVGTGAFNSYGSAMPARVNVALFVSANAAYHLVFTINRSKDANGADTGDGLMLTYRDGIVSATSVTHTRYIVMVPGTQPSLEGGLNYVLTSKNPSETFGGDIGVGVISHFKGLAQQPGTNFLIVNSSDVSAETTVPVTMYGTSRVYIQLNALAVLKALAGSSANDANARCLMRYD